MGQPVVHFEVLGNGAEKTQSYSQDPDGNSVGVVQAAR